MQESRLRTSWIVRRRYQRIGRISSIIGAAIGLLIVAALVRDASMDGSGHMVPRIVVSICIILVCSLGPQLVVRALWRRTRRRNFWEWQ